MVLKKIQVAQAAESHVLGPSSTAIPGTLAGNKIGRGAVES